MRLNDLGGLWYLGCLQLSGTALAFSSPGSLSCWNPHPSGIRDKLTSKDLIACMPTQGLHVENVTPNSHKSLLCRNIKNFHASTVKKENNSEGDLCTCFFRMKTFQELYCTEMLISIRKHILSSAVRPREALTLLSKQLTNENYICLCFCTLHV